MYKQISHSLLAILASAALLAGASPACAAFVQGEAQLEKSGPMALLTEATVRSASEYGCLPFSRPDKLLRYEEWGNSHPELTVEQVVVQVNIGLDKPFYTETTVAEDPDSFQVLVNKYQALPKDYAPQVEWLGTRYGYGSLRPEAAQAFCEMAEAARKDGIVLRSVSAYRAYQSQKTVYERYLRWDSQEVVDGYSARPGFSEHQTGLALDINTASFKDRFEDSEAYTWLLGHCAEYGFILRYPKDKQHLTGYQFEPWHYRYVGKEIAQTCMEYEWTLEEYLARQPNKEEPPKTAMIPGLPLI